MPIDVGSDDSRETSYWLMKSEPESRIEKGHDVKFSVEDLEASNGPVAWDGKINLPICLSLCRVI